MGFIKLKDQYKVRKEPEGGLIFDSRYERILRKIHRIPDLHLGILRLANGNFTKIDFVQIISQAFSVKEADAEQFVEKIITTYQSYLETSDVKIERSDIYLVSNYPDSIRTKSIQRLAAPLLLTMVLTYGCHCQCKYCFADASPEKSANFDLNTEEIIKVMEQCKEIGISTIAFSGGEPFLRPDIYQILSKCNQLNLKYAVTTKKSLLVSDIIKLKESGLTELRISLDSIDDNITQYLTGIPNYATTMMETIKTCLNYGIHVIVNTVVTSHNIDVIPDLIKKLDGAGVKEQIISPYMRSIGRHSEDLFPTELQYKKLSKSIRELELSMEIGFSSVEFQHENQLENIERCTAGRAGIVVLPNGKVTICEKLQACEEFIVGDIRVQKLMDIWNSDALLEVIAPDKEFFKGKDCYSCEHFETCVLDKGLCYVRSKAIYGAFYDKDPFCPKSAVQRIF